MSSPTAAWPKIPLPARIAKAEQKHAYMLYWLTERVREENWAAVAQLALELAAFKKLLVVLKDIEKHG